MKNIDNELKKLMSNRAKLHRLRAATKAQEKLVSDAERSLAELLSKPGNEQPEPVAAAA
jgi:hypothetical protein